MAEEFLAVVIQHEYDHLEGILFPDRVSALRRRLLSGKLLGISKGKFDVDYKFHLSSIETVIYCCQAVKSSPSACPLSLPMRKRRGISRSAR